MFRIKLLAIEIILRHFFRVFIVSEMALLVFSCFCILRKKLELTKVRKLENYTLSETYIFPCIFYTAVETYFYRPGPGCSKAG